MARCRYGPGEGITGRMLATAQPIIVQDIDAESQFLCRAVERAQLPQDIVAFIALPIEMSGAMGREVIGVLACHRIRSRDRQLADDVAILKILATLAGQLLQALVLEKTRALQAKNQLLTRALETAAARYGIIGTSPALLQALSELERVSEATASVLLLGESGTGKELFARAVHLSSQRRDQPFIKVNCAAIPDTLFESWRVNSPPLAALPSPWFLGFQYSAPWGGVLLFRTLRLRARRLHRRADGAGWLVRAGRPGHDFSRRNWRDAAGDADQTAAHAAGRHHPSAGRQARSESDGARVTSRPHGVAPIAINLVAARARPSWARGTFYLNH